MRILGFSKKWDKLNNIEFTTFRFPRKDKDWFIGEEVRVVFKPRSKNNRDELGVAKIVQRESRNVTPHFYGYYYDSSKKDHIMPAPTLTNDEAIQDGFQSYADMKDWLIKTYGVDKICWQSEPMNKLTLRWKRNEVC